MALDSQLNLRTCSNKGRVWRGSMVRPAPAMRDSLAKKLASLRHKGGTNIFGALKAALQIKTVKYGSRYGIGVDEIFLLSDGAPTVGEVIQAEAILNLIRATTRYLKVRINTVYMGGGGDSDFMRRLAEENGGRYLRL